MIAGQIGLDPGPFTLRELMWMAEGAGRLIWGPISELLAMTANINRDPRKSSVFRAYQFNPYEYRKQRIMKMPFLALKGVFGLGLKQVNMPDLKVAGATEEVNHGGS